MKTAVERVHALFGRYRGLYAPSVISEAAGLLDELLDTLERHGHSRTGEASGMLVQAAADAVAEKYRRGRPDLTPGERSQLEGSLRDAFLGEGLVLAPSQVRLGVAVEPLKDGRTWGVSGTGLAVALYTDSGWELMVNQLHTTVHTIHAPLTGSGAREVAVIVHQLLKGQLPNPFAQR
ncbi:hypothetical protein AB0A05_27135 [Streptomyces sp. NPDC046374]|uniref:hypothetical protein n=1 Tax=Streptomyces sp. NPDC046374 TaxID=3154917 RepID=UPI0033DBAFB8